MATSALDSRALKEYKEPMANNPPLCPACGQPASPALPTHDYDWECRNDECPQEGLPISAEATSSS